MTIEDRHKPLGIASEVDTESMVCEEIAMELERMAEYASIGARYAALGDYAGLTYTMQKCRAYFRAAIDNLKIVSPGTPEQRAAKEQNQNGVAAEQERGRGSNRHST